jgi:hypothetical protein
MACGLDYQHIDESILGLSVNKQKKKKKIYVGTEIYQRII